MREEYMEAIDKAVELLILVLFGDEERGLEGLVWLAGNLSGYFFKRDFMLHVMSDRYPEKYSEREVRELARDISEIVKNLGTVSIVTQFLDRHEKAVFLRLMKALRDGRATASLARAWVHFAVMYAWRVEALGLAELLLKSDIPE